MGYFIKQHVSLICLATVIMIMPSGCEFVRQTHAGRYIVIHRGQSGDFVAAQCVQAFDARDAAGSTLALGIQEDLLSRNSSFRRCKGDERIRLRIAVTLGRGVCIDCASVSDLYSGFAFIVVTNADDDEVAAAEWQAWNASTTRAVADMFVDDLAALIREGVTIEPAAPLPPQP